GSIVLVSSVANVKRIPFYVTYCATKAAMRSFVRSWAADFKDRGIRVNTLSPGPIDTPMLESNGESKEQADALKTQFAQATTPLDEWAALKKWRRPFCSSPLTIAASSLALTWLLTAV